MIKYFFYNKRKISLQGVFLFVILPYALIAQKQDYNWCFGDSCGASFISLNPTPFVSALGLDPFFSAGFECAASISDTSGNLLFYTNGTQVWNKNHQVILDGTELNTNTSVTQGALIIPIPTDSYRYYLFNLYAHPLYPGLYFSIIDMTLDTGLGGIDSNKKNVRVDSINVGEKLMAVRNANGRDWWILHTETNKNNFYIYLLTPDSLIPFSVQGIGSSADHADIGEMNFTPDGSKLVASRKNGSLYLFDFDRCNGMLSNPISIAAPGEDVFYGTSFSPNGLKLYASSFQNLYQFDLTVPDIASTQTLIWHNSYYNSNDPTNSYFLCQHQLAPDGKIYLTLASPNYDTYVDTFIDKSLCVINKPNELGATCDFEADAFYLGGKHSGFGLPNLPNYNLGNLIGSPCDTLFNSTSTVGDFINEISVFPNPATEEITVTVQNATILHQLLLYDLFGRVIYSCSFKSSIRISLKNFTGGVYLYEVRERAMTIGKGEFVKM